MNYRIRNVVIAIGLAALAAILTSFYVANYKRTVRSDEEGVTVYVAAKEVPAGTTGAEAFERGLIRKDEVARRSVVPGAISEPDQVDELVASVTVYEGEQVSVRRFVPVEAAGVRAELKGNLRAFQLAGDANQLLAGTLKKGDHVDLIANFKAQGDEKTGMPEAFARTVLRDLLVLRAPTTSFAAAKVESSNTSYAVQLAVTDAQAQKLFFGTQNGEWHLTVRAVADSTDSAESIETIQTVLCDGMRRSTVCAVIGGR